MADYKLVDVEQLEADLAAVADAIRAKNGTTDTIAVSDMAAQIEAITAGGSSESGGAEAEGVSYVTYVSGDGEELCKTACMTGDSTVDPYEDGKIAAPTKQPSVSQVYAYAGGWSLTDGGEADAAALTDVTEDRTVYAVYSASPREYTVNFYDDDGTTLLESLQVAYGEVPGPTKPTKEGYYHSAWEPELAAVTGDADYVAVWAEQSWFQRSSFEEISEICEAGSAADYFEVGDTRTFTGTDGNEYTMYVIALNADVKSDGSGYAGITFAVTDATRGTTYTTPNYSASLGTSFYSNVIPDDLKAVMKSVTKKTYYRGYSSGNYTYNLSTLGSKYVFDPSWLECGQVLNEQDATCEGLAVPAYPGLATQEERAKLGTGFWMRTKLNGYGETCIAYSSSSGSLSSVKDTNTFYAFPIVVCGCI